MAEKKVQKSSSKAIPRIAKHEEEKFIVDRNYFPEALSLVVGFIGGFGVGKTFKEPPRKED